MQSPSCHLPSSLCVPKLFHVFRFRNTQSKIFEKILAHKLSGVQRGSAFSSDRTDFSRRPQCDTVQLQRTVFVCQLVRQHTFGAQTEHSRSPVLRVWFSLSLPLGFKWLTVKPVVPQLRRLNVLNYRNWFYHEWRHFYQLKQTYKMRRPKIELIVVTYINKALLLQ